MTDPALTLADLLTVEDPEDVLNFLLTQLSAAGVPVTDWQEGGVLLTLAEQVAVHQADLTAVVPELAAGGLLPLAAGAWLDLLAASEYGLTRVPAQSAVLRVRLTNASATPYTITPGQLWLTLDPATTLRWNSANTGSESLPGSGTLDLDFRGESPGGAYNVPPVDTDPVFIGASLLLQTPLPGVTVVAIEVLDDALDGLGTSMVTAGADAETDAQLRARCTARWAALAWAGPAASYLSWATEASQSVRRVFVDDTNPDGPGTATVYLASDVGSVGADDRDAVDALIQVRKPPTAVITVALATTTTVTFAATVACPAGKRPAARATIYAALYELQKASPIGDGAGGGKLLWSQVLEILMAADGVTNVPRATLLLNGSADDVTPALGAVLVWDTDDVNATMDGITWS